MAHSEEIEAFLEESRKVGVPEVKALEAALDDVAAFIPGGEASAPARKAFIEFLMKGQEYVRLERELAAKDAKEANNG